jgi:hypothetical protein
MDLFGEDESTIVIMRLTVDDARHIKHPPRKLGGCFMWRRWALPRYSLYPWLRNN